MTALLLFLSVNQRGRAQPKASSLHAIIVARRGLICQVAPCVFYLSTHRSARRNAKTPDCTQSTSKQILSPPSPGYTERPARVQFMLGRVGLYEYHTYTHQRPDSSRPQAARSRVACAKRCGRPHCGHQRMAVSTLMGSAGRPIMASCLSRARRAASSSGVNSKSKRSAFS